MIDINKLNEIISPYFGISLGHTGISNSFPTATVWAAVTHEKKIIKEYLIDEVVEEDIELVLNGARQWALDQVIVLIEETVKNGQ